MDSQYVDFIDELIKRRDFRDITPEVRDALKKDAMERFDNFMLHRMITAFTPEDADAFIALIKEKNSTEEIGSFAKEHIPDYQAFMTSALTEFSKSYIGINT